jgi:hypothetical protein
MVLGWFGDRFGWCWDSSGDRFRIVLKFVFDSCVLVLDLWWDNGKTMLGWCWGGLGFVDWLVG